MHVHWSHLTWKQHDLGTQILASGESKNHPTQTYILFIQHINSISYRFLVVSSQMIWSRGSSKLISMSNELNIITSMMHIALWNLCWINERYVHM